MQLMNLLRSSEWVPISSLFHGLIVRNSNVWQLFWILATIATNRNSQLDASSGSIHWIGVRIEHLCIFLGFSFLEILF